MPDAHHDLDAWLSYIQGVHFRSIDMGLERVEVVLRRLTAGPRFSVIVVGGTNGKGSCAALLGSILAAAGHRVGVYTSPHLVRFNERIEVDGRAASNAVLCRALARIDALRGDIPLTYFEFSTLAAVQVFEQAEVEFAVMEVGMGGRLDAVNALPVDASLITNVALDHIHWLGADREAIGREKAHIMRPATTAVFNHHDPPPSVLAHAAAIDTWLLVAGRDYGYTCAEDHWRWRGPRGEDWELPWPTLSGAVQLDNAAGVLALLSGLPRANIDRRTAALGLRRVRLHGRCEIVARNPLVMIDVAHNESAIETLIEQLRSNPVAGRTHVVFGMLADKDPEAAARALGSLVDVWHLAGIEGARGQTAEHLARVVSRAVAAPLHCHADALGAYRQARNTAHRDDRLVVFGSFHIAGDILDCITEMA